MVSPLTALADEQELEVLGRFRSHYRQYLITAHQITELALTDSNGSRRRRSV